MHDDLIGYLLGGLEMEEIRLVEEWIASDPEVRTQVEVFRLCLARLEFVRQSVDAPEGLAVRTCCCIWESKDAGQAP